MRIGYNNICLGLSIEGRNSKKRVVSQIVMMVRNNLMHYIDFITFMENLSQDERKLVEKNV